MGILDDLKAKQAAQGASEPPKVEPTDQATQASEPVPPVVIAEEPTATTQEQAPTPTPTPIPPTPITGQVPASKPGEVLNTTAKSPFGRPPYRDPKGEWKAEFPYPLPNGDTVLDEDLPGKSDLAPEALPMAQVLATHRRKLIKKGTSQRYPFLMDCSCGFQARVYTEAELRIAADNHVRNQVKLSPK